MDLPPSGRQGAAQGVRSFATAFKDDKVSGVPVRIYNPTGAHRVLVTKDLPGTRWLDILVAANCRVEVRRCIAPSAEFWSPAGPVPAGERTRPMHTCSAQAGSLCPL